VKNRIDRSQVTTIPGALRHLPRRRAPGIEQDGRHLRSKIPEDRRGVVDAGIEEHHFGAAFHPTLLVLLDTRKTAASLRAAGIADTLWYSGLCSFGLG
jgi:hypothetical protein